MVLAFHSDFVFLCKAISSDKNSDLFPKSVFPQSDALRFRDLNSDKIQPSKTTSFHDNKIDR